MFDGSFLLPINAVRVSIHRFCILYGTAERYCFSKKIFFTFLDEFRSKVACENEIIQLTCSPYWRITIYSASYGRTEYESVQCAQPQGVLEESK